MSDITIARLSGDDEEVGAYSAILSWAFSVDVETVPAWLTRAGHDNVRLAWRGSRIAGGLIQIPMGQWFGGRSVPMSGIAGVAVGPEHRGQGAAISLMRASVVELAEARVALSALYPATLALYRKAGYESAGSRFRCSVRTRDIPTGSRELSVRSVDESDHEAIRATYAGFARDQNGYLDRGAYIWNRVRQPRAAPAQGYLVESDGRLEGYLYIQQTRTQRGHYDLGVVDLAAATPRAGRALLGLVAEHRTLGDTTVFSCGAADPVLSLLPESYECELADHWMLRVTDAEAALGARGYPVATNARLELELDDDLVPHNRGRFVLEVEGGQGRLSRGGNGTLRTGPRGLAALYTGFMHPASLARAGLVEGDERSLAKAAALFAGAAPCMRDHF